MTATVPPDDRSTPLFKVGLLLDESPGLPFPQRASGGEDDNQDKESTQWLSEPGTHEAITWLEDENHVLFEGSKEEMLQLIHRFKMWLDLELRFGRAQTP